MDKVCGVTTPKGSWAEVSVFASRLKELPPKSWLRGKFEAWFLIKYLGMVLTTLRVIARESGGDAVMRTSVHSANFVEVLAPRIAEPESLGTFLSGHL